MSPNSNGRRVQERPENSRGATGFCRIKYAGRFAVEAAALSGDCANYQVFRQHLQAKYVSNTDLFKIRKKRSFSRACA
jgi:hypothetical protein